MEADDENSKTIAHLRDVIEKQRLQVETLESEIKKLSEHVREKIEEHKAEIQKLEIELGEQRVIDYQKEKI